MNDVVNLKLVSGEELIAVLVEKTIQKVTLDTPLIFVLTHNKEDSVQGNVSFAPWMIGRDTSEYVDISRDHILAISNPNEQARQAYLEATGKANSSLTSSPRQVLNG